MRKAGLSSRSADAARDSIFISHIGYQSVVLFINGADTGMKTIALKEKALNCRA